MPLVDLNYHRNTKRTIATEGCPSVRKVYLCRNHVQGGPKNGYPVLFLG